MEIPLLGAYSRYTVRFLHGSSVVKQLTASDFITVRILKASRGSSQIAPIHLSAQLLVMLYLIALQHGMLDARPDEDDPEFDEKSRRASQRPNTDLGRSRSLHRRGSLGGLVDGLWQIKSEHPHSRTTSVAHDMQQSKAGHVNTQGASKSSIAAENVDAHVPTAAAQAESHFGASQKTPLTSDDNIQGELHSRIVVPDQGVMDDSVKLGIVWCDPDAGRASPIAKLTLGSVVDSDGDERGIARPPTGPSTTASASLCLSPQEMLDESIELGTAWCDPADAGDASPIASVTLTSLADPGDETFGIASKAQFNEAGRVDCAAAAPEVVYDSGKELESESGNDSKAYEGSDPNLFRPFALLPLAPTIEQEADGDQLSRPEVEWQWM